MALEDWDKDEGRVSRAFNDWETNIEELRGFFEHATHSCEERFDQRWQHAARATAGTEHDTYDVFETWSQILPRDLSFLLRAMVVKEAFTSFEVYLENGISEARRALRKTPLGGPDGRPVPWTTLVDSYAALAKPYARKFSVHGYIASPVESEAVLNAATLRHVLTHRRGYVQGERDRLRLAKLIDPSNDRVRLTDQAVTETMDSVDNAVHALDPMIWALAWNRRVRGRVLRLDRREVTTLA